MSPAESKSRILEAAHQPITLRAMAGWGGVTRPTLEAWLTPGTTSYDEEFATEFRMRQSSTQIVLGNYLAELVKSSDPRVRIKAVHMAFGRTDRVEHLDGNASGDAKSDLGGDVEKLLEEARRLRGDS